MKEKIRLFLESDLLENYLLGSVSQEEALQVERYISMYPEVRDTYLELQCNLEAFAKMHARKAPDGLQARILQTIRAQDSGRKRFRYFAVAASFAAMLFAGSSYFFWNQSQDLQQENIVVSNQIKSLEENMREQLEDVRNQFIVLNNPQTKKYEVHGNKKAEDLKAVAYINPVKKLSYINLQNLPHLPDNQCYQMWAEVNGEMVNIGVLKNVANKDKLWPLPYAEKAVGYITIEPEGGNNTPTVQNIVANISY